MIAVIKGCGHNLTSLVNALQHLSTRFIVTDHPKLIARASKVILPGVGNAGKAMRQLIALDLVDTLRSLEQPFLGICLGMQLLYDYSEEEAVHCLGVIPSRIQKFTAARQLPVPHMGWNKIDFSPKNKLFTDIKLQSYFYFVHSYYAAISEWTLAKTHYGQDFSAVVQKNNFIGMQFHPERSGSLGLKVLENFVRQV